jgi:hypothetical protein
VINSRSPRFGCALSCHAKMSHQSSSLGYNPNCGFFSHFLSSFLQGDNFLEEQHPTPPLQIYVIILGFMGDGLLPARCQELFYNFSSLLLGYGVTYKTDNKSKNNIHKIMGATCGSNKERLEKMPIYRATENLIILQIIQPVGVISTCLRDFEGPDP